MRREERTLTSHAHTAVQHAANLVSEVEEIPERSVTMYAPVQHLHLC